MDDENSASIECNNAKTYKLQSITYSASHVVDVP